MTTTVTKTIGAGGDCADLNAFDALLPASLVTADQCWVGYVLAGEIVSSTLQQITAHTTDATRFITLMANPGAGFAENATKNANPLAYDATKGSSLRNSLASSINYQIAPHFTVVKGLQFKSSNTLSYELLRMSGNSTIVEGNIFDSASTYGVSFQGGSSGFIFRRNLLKCAGVKYEGNLDAYQHTTAGVVTNNTIIVSPAATGSGGRGVGASYTGGTLVKNNAIFGMGTAVGPEMIAASVNNAADTVFSGGTGNIGSLSFANQFMSTTDFRRKTGNALAAAGATVTGFTTDILGNTLASPPTIGAAELDGTAADTANPTMTGTVTSTVTSNSGTIDWSGTTRGDDIGITGYETSPDGGTTWNDRGNVTSYTYTGLTPSTAYTRLVRAYDLSGKKSTPALSVTFTTSAVDTTAPTVLTSPAPVVANATPTVVVITMSETLAASVPPASAFTFSLGRTATATSVSGSTVSVTFTPALAYGDVMTVAYTMPGANPRIQDSAANITTSFGAQAITNNVAAVAGNVIDTSLMLFSPGNWNLGATSARTVNAGAYFRTLFGGTTCSLQFDMTSVTSPSDFYYRIDGFGPFIRATVASTVVLTMPSPVTGWANAGGHLLEFVVRNRPSTSVQSWTSPACMVALTGVILDAGKALVKPLARPLKGIVFGDSITEGNGTVLGGDDATLGYAYHLQNHLSAEIGVVGFGSQGWTVGGAGGVPVFGTAYSSHYSGAARSFAGLDFVLINQGTNDASGDVQTPAIATLNALISAVPSTCKIIIMRPFNGMRNSDLLAAVAACSTPARVNYIDSTGFFTTANSNDSIHPYGNEHITHIAPTVANSVRAILAGGPTLTTRTVTLTLGDTNGASANLTGLQWTWQDTFSGAVLSSGTTGTTNASGVFSVSISTTLASGGVGNLKILGAANAHYNGPCAVA